MPNTSLTGVPSQWQDYIAQPGSANAALDRARFISEMTTISGGSDMLRSLFLPLLTDGATTTDASRRQQTWTHVNTAAGRLTALGSGVALSCNGTTDGITTPDLSAYSYGDGLNDSSFSVVALVNVTDTAATRTITAKRVATSNMREWQVSIGTDDALRFDCLSLGAATNTIAKRVSSATAQGSWALFSVTYDGTRSEAGQSLYVGATPQTVTSSGTTPSGYTAMLDGTAVLSIGINDSSNFFAGSIACVGLVARQLQLDDLAALVALCNSYFNLTLTP